MQNFLRSPLKPISWIRIYRAFALVFGGTHMRPIEDPAAVRCLAKAAEYRELASKEADANKAAEFAAMAERWTSLAENYRDTEPDAEIPAVALG
jgi:hypothetical protein